MKNDGEGIRLSGLHRTGRYLAAEKTMRNELSLRAYGKINLGLDVLRKREDGYHEVKMIMQTVSLYDQIRLRREKKPGIRIRTNLPYLPTGEGNLVYKAAELLMKEAGIPDGLFIDLYKKIPVAAGMAGGSSDAAAVLVGVNRLFGLQLSKKQLEERGVTLGADIPYCIMRGTALSEGIGEKLTRLASMPDCHILLAKPPISVSTKFVYSNLKAAELSYHPDIDGMVQALADQDLPGVLARMGNVLETVTIPAHPQIGIIKERMLEAGAKQALMSGSGPTVFGIFSEKEQAERAGKQIRREGLARQIYTVKPYHTKGESGGNRWTGSR